MHVFDTLRKNQLIVIFKKIDFGKESFIYLRHKINGGEMRVDLDKIASINYCPTPTSFIEERSFMGEAKC